jgi:hypothetical protein
VTVTFVSVTLPLFVTVIVKVAEPQPDEGGFLGAASMAPGA